MRRSTRSWWDILPDIPSSWSISALTIVLLSHSCAIKRNAAQIELLQTKIQPASEAAK